MWQEVPQSSVHSVIHSEINKISSEETNYKTITTSRFVCSALRSSVNEFGAYLSTQSLSVATGAFELITSVETSTLALKAFNGSHNYGSVLIFHTTSRSLALQLKAYSGI